MKLYYAQATCSHAPHIALREAGLEFQLVKFDMKAGTVEGGAPIASVHEKGYVPILELDSGERLTEAAVILQYVAEHSKTPGLLPPPGIERWRAIEWLNFIATEIHKIYWPLFHDGTEVEMQKAREKLGRSFSYVEKHLKGPWMLGEQFTVVDAYLVTVLNWSRAGGLDLARWPRLKDYRDRARQRPAVLAAMQAEGMIRPRA